MISERILGLLSCIPGISPREAVDMAIVNEGARLSMNLARQGGEDKVTDRVVAGITQRAAYRGALAKLHKAEKELKTNGIY